MAKGSYGMVELVCGLHYMSLENDKKEQMHGLHYRSVKVVKPIVGLHQRNPRVVELEVWTKL